LDAWIHHLLLNASKELKVCKTATVISKDDTVSFESLAGPDARAELERLTGYFLDGQQSPLCFFPETSRAFAEAIVKAEEPVAQALQTAQKKWDPGEHHKGEVEDIYLQRSFGMEMPAGPEFQETALNIFKPLLAAMNK